MFLPVVDSGWSAPAVVYFCIEPSNLSATGFISWTDATLCDRWDEATCRPCANNSLSQPVWTRPGEPIQTTSLCSRAPSPLKQSEKLFIYCRPAFGLVPCNTLTQRGEVVGTCIQEQKEWAIVSLSTAGWVSVGFIIFSTYWHVHLVAPLNLHDVFLHETSHITEQFSFWLPPVIIYWSIKSSKNTFQKSCAFLPNLDGKHLLKKKKKQLPRTCLRIDHSGPAAFRTCLILWLNTLDSIIAPKHLFGVDIRSAGSVSPRGRWSLGGGLAQLPECLDLLWNMQDESEHLCSFGHSSAYPVICLRSGPWCSWGMMLSTTPGWSGQLQRDSSISVIGICLNNLLILQKCKWKSCSVLTQHLLPLPSFTYSFTINLLSLILIYIFKYYSHLCRAYNPLNINRHNVIIQTS